MQTKKPNHLINETSPYLLQHAYNPVEWFPWGEVAFEKARLEDKPILVSIGYAACHWCHVMEHESFENETTATFMNTYFVNIKVDREERPDVDHIYMNTCQLLTGAGGWPLNVFLTPELLPFSGGTYYPPKPGYGKPSWMEVLMYMKNVFTGERDKVEQQAISLKEHLLKMDQSFTQQLTIPAGQNLFSKEELQQAVQKISKSFDGEDGGFGSSPKFPGSMTLLFLNRINFFEKDEKIAAHIDLSLKKMMLGGIYDQIGGGFARYTVDKKWMIPHFEKMLYDNALLMSLYAEVYRQNKNEDHKKIIQQTLQFIERELMNEEGGFYASYDADSEGEEGKYYTFTGDEIKNILGDNAPFAEKLYNITPSGNWEHTNILFRTKTNNEIIAETGLSEEKFYAQLDEINQQLFDYRKKRIKPGLDNKILLSWNALMCSAYVQAYKALHDEHYRQVAVRNVEFLLEKFSADNHSESLLHVYTNGLSKFPAFIDDYSALIQALIDVYEITSEEKYLQRSIAFTAYINEHFLGNDGQYFITNKSQADIPLRSKDYYDNATPSGNSIMANNLIRLAILSGDNNYHIQAEKMITQLKTTMLTHGTSFGNWLNAALTLVYPFAEVGITGTKAAQLRDEIVNIYYPNLIIQTDEKGISAYPLVNNRSVEEKSLIYLCRNNSCQLPVSTVQDFIQLLNKF